MREPWEIYWKDYYCILQIHPLAEPEVVKKAYLALVSKYHPDHHAPNNKEWATGKTKEIIEAGEILNDSEKRGRYFIAYQQKVYPMAQPGGWQAPNLHKTQTNTSSTPATNITKARCLWCGLDTLNITTGYCSRCGWYEKKSAKQKTANTQETHKNGLGNLHEKGRYKGKTEGKGITIFLIVFIFCIALAPWYMYWTSHIGWWLFLCIPLSVVCLPVLIIWISELFKP